MCFAAGRRSGAGTFFSSWLELGSYEAALRQRRDCVKTAEGHAFRRAMELLSIRPALAAEGLALRA